MQSTTAVPTAAQFKLYFKENARIGTPKFKKPYLGTSFMFYTPLLMSTNSPNPYPTTAETSKYTWIKMRFRNEPRLAKGAAVTIAEAAGSSITIPLSDTINVKIQWMYASTYAVLALTLVAL